MKIPRTPPNLDDIVISSRERTAAVARAASSSSSAGKYLHWDKLIRYSPPEGLTHEEWWFALKIGRSMLSKHVPLTDKQGKPFEFVLTDPIPQQLHEIDLSAGGRVEMPSEILSPETRDKYLVSSLIEEAITSSQLEGATTTRQVAKEMIRTNRPPRDRSERMILNNYLAMQRIQQLKDQPLSKALVFELHRRVTSGTLDDATAAGRFRRPDEDIIVGDWDDPHQVLHRPPHASELDARMTSMCDFANGLTPATFVHPALRSIILHFWLAYDHPFTDGNGRTARALFYWSMLRHGYWLAEFISISRVALRAPAKYGRAFLYTETDDNDLTYFILYHIDVIRQAIAELTDYIKQKTAQVVAIDRELRNAPFFNYRQRTLLSHALRHPQFRYTIESHRVSHNVVYQTARTDLLELQERGLLIGIKIGRTWYFTPVDDLHNALTRLRID